MEFDPLAQQDIATMLQQVAMLRRQQYDAPRGQMVSGHYVKPAMSQQLNPLLSGIVADVTQDRAKEKQREFDQAAQADLAQWLRRRPQTQEVVTAGDAGPTQTLVPPTDDAMAGWAASGLRNPLTKGIANASLTDNIVNAPIREEKQRDKVILQQGVDRRMDQERETRIQMAREALQGRLDVAQMRLDAARAQGAETNAIRLQIAGMNNEAKRLAIEAGDRRAAERYEREEQKAGQKAEAAANKPMGATDRKELQKHQVEYDSHDRLYKSFDPSAMYVANPDDPASIAKAQGAADYGGKAAAQIALDPAARQKALRTNQWWAQFRSGDNVVRNGLFGSALTENEQKLWKQTTVGPSDTEQKIREAIEIRREITAKKYNDYLEGAQGKRPQPIAPKASTNPLLRNRVTPGEQAGRDNEAAKVIQREYEKNLAIENPTPRDLADREALVRELARAGVKVEAPAAPAPKPAAATGGWSIRRKD